MAFDQREYQRLYWQSHRDEKRASNRRYRQGHRKELRAKALARYWANPEKARAINRASDLKCNLVRRYGINGEQYEAMCLAQGGKCLICEASGNRLGIDHDHKTQAVRGLLCRKCNMALGLFCEDPRIINRAAEYLDNAKN